MTLLELPVPLFIEVLFLWTFQITCIASLYNLYNERVEKFIDEDRPTVFSASASQSFIDTPSSHYSSYHDSHDTVNNNDAQIQGELPWSCLSHYNAIDFAMPWREGREKENTRNEIDIMWSEINSKEVMNERRYAHTWKHLHSSEIVHCRLFLFIHTT